MKVNRSKLVRKFMSTVLAAVMAFVMMSEAGMAVFAEDEDGISLTYGQHVFSKVSNPASGSKKPDGINTNDITGFPANRLNSYAWAVASREDSIYIGTNRTLFGAALNTVTEVIQQQNTNISQELMGEIVRVLSGGEVPVNLPEEEYIPQIIRFDVKDGSTEVIYQPGTAMGTDGRLYYTEKDGSIVPDADVSSETASFRSVVEYKGNLYFGSLGANMLQVVRIDENDNADVVFQTIGSFSSLRAGCTFDDGSGETIYYGGQDATYGAWAQYRQTHPDEPAPLPIVIRRLDPATAGTDQENWDGLVADFTDFGEYAYARVYTYGGGNVWDLCAFNGNLYLILAYDGGWAMFRGEKGGIAPNKFGWTWTEIVGNNGRYPLAMNPELAGLNEQYRAAYGCNEYKSNLIGAGLLESTATPYVYNGKMYIGSFDNATSIQADAVIKALTKLQCLTTVRETGDWGPSLTQIFAPIYEVLSHPQHIWVMDENETIEPVESANELLDGTMNDYVWRFIENDGKLYVGTFDASTAYNYYLDYPVSRLLSLLEEEGARLSEYLQQLINGSFSENLLTVMQRYNKIPGEVPEEEGGVDKAGAAVEEETQKTAGENSGAAEALGEDETADTAGAPEEGAGNAPDNDEIVDEAASEDEENVETAGVAAESDFESTDELRQKYESAAVNASILAEAFLRDDVSVEQLLDAMTELESAKTEFQETIGSASLKKLSADGEEKVDPGSDKACEMIEWLQQFLDVQGLEYWARARALIRQADSGFDILVSEDGEKWERIVSDGLNDPYNYGARTFTICNDELYVGTANPYFGAQLWKVTDCSPAVVKEPSAVKKLTYTGSDLELVTPGVVKGGTIVYKVGGSAQDETGWDPSVPTAVNAGTYTVCWKVIGDEKHFDLPGAEISVKIDKAQITGITSPKAKKLTYTGSAQKLVTAGKCSGRTIKYSLDNKSYSATIPSKKNAGTYKVYWKVYGDANYKDKTGTPISVTISKAAAKITVKTASKSYTAAALKKSAQTFSIGASANSKGKLSYAVVSYGNTASKKSLKFDTKTGKVTVNKGTVKGTYSVKVKITAKATDNYKAAAQNKTIKVTVK